jgi:hypothetical protein
MRRKQNAEGHSLYIQWDWPVDGRGRWGHGNTPRKFPHPCKPYSMLGPAEIRCTAAVPAEDPGGSGQASGGEGHGEPWGKAAIWQVKGKIKRPAGLDMKGVVQTGRRQGDEWSEWSEGSKAVQVVASR